MNLVFMALAPILILLFYVYIRDKYEKEPYMLLFVGVAIGFILTYPIIFFENLMLDFMPYGSAKFEAFYLSFVVAALVEEGLKFLVMIILIWQNKNYNEKYDGIVYSVFIALGFASCENIMYVTNDVMGGVETALLRSIISVPAHCFYGIFMGYYFSRAKYKNKLNLILAFLIPFGLHGLLDFILSTDFYLNIFVLISYIIILSFISLFVMKKYVSESPFKNTNSKYK